MTASPTQGLPLSGVRVLAAEQMVALPFATQLLGRLGADVVKVEHPVSGESARGSQPSITDPDGRAVGATFLRSNFHKRSVGLDLKSPEGVELFLALAPNFDVVCENFKAGTADRLGIGFDAVSERHPQVIYLSVSGFGSDPATPYFERPAYAAIVEAMSGIYEYKRRPGRPPTANPVGALGDISSALFGVIGVMAALRQRSVSGESQRVDIAMLDATVAMTDIVTNFYSMGIPDEMSAANGIVETFAAGEGHFVLQVVRHHQFQQLAELTGNEAWLDDERLAAQKDWQDHLEDVIRPAVEGWASRLTSTEAVAELTGRGLAAGESRTSREVVEDPHLQVRNMLSAISHEGGDPVLVPGNPVKLSTMPELPEDRVPWLGEHTDAVLTAELGIDAERLRELREQGVIG